MSAATSTSIALATALVALAAAPAAAAPEVVLVPATGGLGGEMPGIASSMNDVVKRVARANGLTAEIANATRDDVFTVAGCSDDSDVCHQAVLRTLGAKKLILVHVTPGSGGATADVEIILASWGQPAVKTTLTLIGDTADEVLADLERKAPPAFGGSAKPAPAPTVGPPGADPTGPPSGGMSGPPGADQPPVPTENSEIGGALAPGEGKTFSAPVGGETAGATKSPAEAAATPPPASEPSDAETEGRYDFTRVNNTTWAIGGAGVGLFVTGIVLLASASGKQDDVNNARTNSRDDFSRLEDLESTGKVLNTLGNTSLLLGLVGIGAASYLVYRDARIPESERGKVSIAPALWPDGIGIVATVRR